MKQGSARLMVFALLAAASVGSPASAQDSAPGNCSGKTIRGSYAFKQTGVLYAPNLALPNGDVPRIAAVGVASFDGTGNLTLTGVNSFGGHIVPFPPGGIAAKHTLDFDCSGTISLMGPSGPETIYFVVAHHGRRMYGIYTTPTGADPGPVVTIDFMKQ
jgi:hypothetical protein